LERPWFRFWPPWVPRSIPYPEVPLQRLLEESADRYPDRAAIIFRNSTITYGELNALADRFAAALKGLGVARGDRVALHLPNTPQFVISYYGALKAGAIITPVSPLFREGELKHQLNDSGAETIITLDAYYPMVEKVRGETRLTRIIVTGLKDLQPSEEAIRGKAEVSDLLDGYPPQPPEWRGDPREETALLQYTGGTTGTPKGAMLTHYNLVSNAVAWAKWIRGREGEEVFLTVLPLFHIYGMTTSMNAPIYLAGSMILLPRFHPAEVLEAIERHRASILCGVPTLYAMLINYPEIGRDDLSSLRFCVSGGSPLPPEVQRRFMELTGGTLVEGYGLTEASPVTHCNPLDPTMRTVRVGSIGLPLPDTDAKIVDLETGEELPPGGVGELVVRGPQVMKGYWGMPEETGRVLRDGWLHTGDIGRMDEDGYFYIIDRKKDLIKYKGYSVYPRELEDIIYEHPAVKLCAVVGKPDPIAGEIPKAFIVLKDGASATEEEIIRFVEGRVAPYKKVREVEFRRELPLSSVGKVLRRVLREEELQKAKASGSGLKQR